MPPKGRDPNPSGLGRAIINRKIKDARHMQESGLYTTDLDPTSRLKSVTQEKDLDEFFSTAQLAGTEFTAERNNVKIIQSSTGSSRNPYLLSEQEEKNTLQRQRENKGRLRVPRRPDWKKGMTTAQLDRQEKDAFLEWRRGIAGLQEQDGFLLTPFERNIEVWRQLWRVVERSHLVVQIVDARNPLRFRCEDLESYVLDIEGSEGESGSGKGKRRNLLLINKADLLTARQRRLWADYFDTHGITYAFFSAANAAAIQQARRDALDAAGSNDRDMSSESGLQDVAEETDEPNAVEDDGSESESDASESEDEHYFSAEEDTTDGQDPRARVLSVLELEELFIKSSPDLTEFKDSEGKPPSKLVVGLVGYPNVGKSSTINSLLGEKKVSVSSTPGKTKHFQTIHLSDHIVLCDCPGLVFPQFATTRADLVCDGVLPIDQLREYTGPVSLVADRIPKEILEAVYGLSIKTQDTDEGGDGKVKAEDLLIAYAIGRGFMRSGQGNPDEARAARYILKDYVNAKILYSHPPPDISSDVFNEKAYQLAMIRAAEKKHAPTTRVGKNADTFVPFAPNSVINNQGGLKTQNLDNNFFDNQGSLLSRPLVQGSLRSGSEFSRGKAFPHQNSVTNDGTTLDARQARLLALTGVANEVGKGKKHHKKTKRVKQRSGKGYD